MRFGFLTYVWMAMLGAVAFAAPASANVGQPLDTCIRPAAVGQTPAAMFADPGGFDCQSVRGHKPAGDYWVLAPHSPQTAIRPIVRSASVWQKSVVVYARYADGTITRTGFDSSNAWRRLKLGAWFELPLPPHLSAPVALLWHVHNTNGLRGVVLAPSITDAADSARHEIGMAALYAGFAGLCIALLIYNLALWRALGQRFQLVYCLMVLCVLGYAFSSSGFLGQLTGIDNNLRLRINAALLGGSAITAMAFARAFFEPAVFAGWLGRTTRAAMIALGASIAAYFVLAPWQATLFDRLCTFAYIALLVQVAPILWRAWHVGSRYTAMFALAWGVPVVLGACRVLAALDMISWSFWLDNSTMLSMALEALLSAIAIAYRIKLLSEERDVARQQEMSARQLADTDPLTGLMNRRSFLRDAIARDGSGSGTDGPGRPWLLVLVDIDHFKAVNETLGHDGGDEVLRVFAAALRTASPPEALVARLGGEEFAILAPVHLIGLPEAVLSEIRAARMPFDIAVTASLGSELGYIADEGDWTALYRRADQALYAAKNAGRDRARWAAVG